MIFWALQGGCAGQAARSLEIFLLHLTSVYSFLLSRPVPCCKMGFRIESAYSPMQSARKIHEWRAAYSLLKACEACVPGSDRPQARAKGDKRATGAGVTGAEGKGRGPVRVACDVEISTWSTCGASQGAKQTLRC